MRERAVRHPMLPEARATPVCRLGADFRLIFFLRLFFFPVFPLPDFFSPPLEFDSRL